VCCVLCAVCCVLCAVCSARSDFVAGIRVGGGYRDMASVVESGH
jgi:hypothetical protein